MKVDGGSTAVNLDQVHGKMAPESPVSYSVLLYAFLLDEFKFGVLICYLFYMIACLGHH